MPVETYTWDDLRKHNTKESSWIAINNKVYDVTEWLKRHPGGTRVISHYAGQDATEAYVSMHTNFELTNRHLKTFLIGDLIKETKSKEFRQKEQANEKLKADMEKLRLKMIELRLFETNYLFFGAMFVQILLLIGAGYSIIKYEYTTARFLIAAILYAISQVQCNWLQHDLGHLSVFKSNRLNHFFHNIVLTFFKGASTNWWNHMHNQHHAKPNVINKDPDVRLHPVLVLGDIIPREAGKRIIPSPLPYNYQDKYFYVLGALLFPVYFFIMSFRHMYTRRLLQEFLWALAGLFLFIKYHYPILGVKGIILMQFLFRSIDSFWFAWVSQSNHLPMPVEYDKEDAWLRLQLQATCNIEQSLFNDWFTGHLNFQVEHHLFPTMPRHNYHKAQPYVKELCKAHNLPYIEKKMSTAFSDIIRSLKKSGKLWETYYYKAKE